MRYIFTFRKANGSEFEIEEHSLDFELIENRAKIEFHRSVILPGSQIFAPDEKSLVILIPTVTAAHRIILTHPKELHRHDTVSTVFSLIVAHSLLIAHQIDLTKT